MPSPKVAKSATLIVTAQEGQNMQFIWCFPQKRRNMLFLCCLSQNGLNLPFILMFTFSSYDVSYSDGWEPNILDVISLGPKDMPEV